MRVKWKSWSCKTPFKCGEKDKIPCDTFTFLPCNSFVFLSWDNNYTIKTQIKKALVAELRTLRLASGEARLNSVRIYWDILERTLKDRIRSPRTRGVLKPIERICRGWKRWRSRWKSWSRTRKNWGEIFKYRDTTLHLEKKAWAMMLIIYY